MITGGTVIGESKKISDYKMAPTQNTFVARTIKKTKGSSSETKNPVKWTVGSVKSSNSCVKFLYSSSNLKKDNYSVKVNGSSKECEWVWSANYGACYVVSSTTN
jgi:hypothetical protein